MATRRKFVAVREQNGRAQRNREHPASQIRRLRDAALAKMSDPKWGTELGRLYLAGRISEVQFAAGEWWAEAAAKFRQAIGAFPMKSPSVELGRGGTSPDPDSDEGRKIAVREAEQAERFFEAHAVLLSAGLGAEKAVRDVCERGVCSIFESELKALRLGLLALAVHRGLTNQTKTGVHVR